MLIIIEGADKTGKTTLAREISERMGYAYKHFGVPGADPATEYARFLIELNKPTICDRFFYGELVYGPLLRGRSVITPLQKTVIERLCRARMALLVHACPAPATMSRRLAEMGDDMITEEQNLKAYVAFTKVLHESSLQQVKFTNLGQDDYKKFIDDNIADFRARISYAHAANVLTTGIGTVYKPRVVLVGEKLNSSATWVGMPFDAGRSSEFLEESLKKTKIPESFIYVVNSDTLNTAEIEYLHDLAAVRFIALGNEASEKLKSFHTAHKKIPHPSFWLRFHKPRTSEYSKVLEEAACL